ncbi:MAG: hypothetical protein ABSE92_16320 [Terriglobales bacterium]|jgi:hypothetical protein
MKKIMVLLLFVFLTMACLAMDTHPQYQSATVVSVKAHETPSNYVGDNPTDAPLVAQDEGYDINLRLNCDIYRLRYQSAIDYLPSVFVPEHEVNVYTKKHYMYVDVAGGRDVPLLISGHHRAHDASCTSN